MSNYEIPPDSELTSLLLGLEKQLMDPELRKDRQKVSALLSEDFREFGSSGRVWSREAILHSLATESNWTAPEVEDFAIQRMSPDAALVTYRTIHPDQRSLRSSLWVRRTGQWRILFHQGTKEDEARPGGQAPASAR